MTYGAEFRNDQSIVVISDSRLIETFIGKAVFNSTPSRRRGRVKRFYIASSLRPMAFVHAKNNYFASILCVVQSGSGYLIDIITNGSESDLEVYCFAQVAGDNTDQGYGMNLYDAQGNPVFSSNWDVLNVRGVVTPGQLNESVNHGVAGLSKPAAMCPSNSGQSVILRGGTSYVEWDDRDVFQLTATQVTTSRVRIWYYDDYYWGVGEPPYDYGSKGSVSIQNASPFPIIDAAQYD